MMNRRMMIVVLTIVLVLISCSSGKTVGEEPITIGLNPSYVMMSLDEIIYESDLIVIGNVDTVYASRWNTPDGKRPEGDPAQGIKPGNLIFTDMDFNVTQLIKGDTQQKKARIRFFGGKVDNVQMMTDETIPEVNKTYLLFLDLDTLGSTAEIISSHYQITGGGFQGLYKINGDKAVSANDEWSLDELIAYIQNSPLSATSPVLSDSPEVKEVMRVIETAYDVEAQASFSFDTEKFQSVFANDPSREVIPEKLEFVKFFMGNPLLKTAGYLDYKTAYYNWWKDSTMRFEALKEKANAENREITQEEINTFIDSKWGMAPARAESPERKVQLNFIAVEIVENTATVYLNDGFQVVVLYLVRIDGQWYIAGDKKNTISVETFAPTLTPFPTETLLSTETPIALPTETPTPIETPTELLTDTPTPAETSTP